MTGTLWKVGRFLALAWAAGHWTRADGGNMPPEDLFDGKTPVVVETKAFKLTINPDATARSLVVKATGEECLLADEKVPVFASTQIRPFNNETPQGLTPLVG